MFALSQFPPVQRDVATSAPRRQPAPRHVSRGRAGTPRPRNPRRGADAASSASPAVYRRRRIAVAVAAMALLALVAGVVDGSAGRPLPERLVGAMLFVGWISAAVALWRWDRCQPVGRVAGSSESCLSLEPASSVPA